MQSLRIEFSFKKFMLLAVLISCAALFVNVNAKICQDGIPPFATMFGNATWSLQLFCPEPGPAKHQVEVRSICCNCFSCWDVSQSEVGFASVLVFISGSVMATRVHVQAYIDLIYSTIKAVQEVILSQFEQQSIHTSGQLRIPLSISADINVQLELI